MPAKTATVPSQEATDELIKEYLSNRVREKAHGDDRALFDSALSLHELAVEREAEHDPTERMEQLRASPLLKGAIAIMGSRLADLTDAGVRVMKDTQVLRRKLRERFAELGINPADPKQRAIAEAEYERMLAATIPLDIALDNVRALSDAVDMANDILNPASALKRSVYEMAWQALRRVIFKDEHVLAKMEAFKRDLQGDRERVTRVAQTIREEGPKVVREAYRRGAKPGGTEAAPRSTRAAAATTTAKPSSSAKASGKPAASAAAKARAKKATGKR